MSIKELTEDTVVGSAHKESEKGLERRKLHQNALDAMEQHNLHAMFAAYQAAVEDRAQMEEAMNLFAGYAMEKAKAGEAHPIASIRDVALAAIALARDVSINHTGSK